ncbi:hypothetical protein C8R46DRAFT_424595 [Mycena filopes]|nr:hypothetical protein C8R46DRAFT_424595 [Mycena filopes]
MKASIIFCAFCFAIFGVHAARAESESSFRYLAPGLSPLPPRRRLTGGPNQAAPSSTPVQCATKKTLGSSLASIDSPAACTILTGLATSASSYGERGLQCKPRVFFDLLARQQHRRLLGPLVFDHTPIFVFVRQALKQHFCLGPSFLFFAFIFFCTSLIVLASPQLRDTSTASGSRNSSSAVSHATSSSAPVSHSSPTARSSPSSAARSSSSAPIPRSSVSAASAHNSSSSSLPRSASSSSAPSSAPLSGNVASPSSKAASSPACSSVPHVFSGASVVLVAHCNHHGRVIRRTPHPLLALACTPDTVVLNYARHRFFGRRASPARRSTRARLSSPLGASASGKPGIWATVADVWSNLL